MRKSWTYVVLVVVSLSLCAVSYSEEQLDKTLDITADRYYENVINMTEAECVAEILKHVEEKDEEEFHKIGLIFYDKKCSLIHLAAINSENEVWARNRLIAYLSNSNWIHKIKNYNKEVWYLEQHTRLRLSIYR